MGVMDWILIGLIAAYSIFVLCTKKKKGCCGDCSCCSGCNKK